MYLCPLETTKLKCSNSWGKADVICYKCWGDDNKMWLKKSCLDLFTYFSCQNGSNSLFLLDAMEILVMEMELILHLACILFSCTKHGGLHLKMSAIPSSRWTMNIDQLAVGRGKPCSQIQDGWMILYILEPTPCWQRLTMRPVHICRWCLWLQGKSWLTQPNC